MASNSGSELLSNDIECESPEGSELGEEKPLVQVTNPSRTQPAFPTLWHESARAPTHRSFKQCLRRTAAGSLAMCLLVGVGFVGAHLKFGGEHIVVTGSSGFVDLYAAQTRALEDDSHLPICDPRIVARICTALNTETQSYYGNNFDADSSVVHALELQEVFMIAKESIVNALEIAGVANLASDGTGTHSASEYAMTCQDLCQKMVASYPPRTLPSRSNLACVTKGWWIFKTVVCERDVSSVSMSNYSMRNLFSPESGAAEKSFNESVAFEAINRLVYTEVSDEENNKMPSDDVEEAELLLQYKRVPFETVRQVVVNMFKIYPPLAATAQMSAPSGPLGRRLSSLPRRLSSWDEAKTLEMAQVAMAYIIQSLERMASRKVGDTVITWYGSNDEVTRSEIKRVMNGVHAMLGHVEYVYPGSYCQPNYYAYVFPSKSYDKNGKRQDRNSKGQYIFNLCDYYFQVGDSEKVETLLHEGAHHLAMALADSQYEGSTMYGRSACKKTANDCKGGSTHACVQALRNADTFCYFVEGAHAEPVVQKSWMDKYKFWR